MRKTKSIHLFCLLFSVSIISCANVPPAPQPEPTKTVNIVAFNDFHGAIDEEGEHIGLLKLGSFIKEKSGKKNTLVLSQGDDWQGSIYSNHNRGQLVTDVFNYAGLSARTVGNHDFDWGVDAIKANTARSYEGRTTPTLAANIYDYDFTTKTVGHIQQSDIGQKTTTYTLDNGLKVGIVGVIGSNQITAISSYYVQDIHFVDHIQVIKDEATNLREDGCDIVIACVHGGEEDVLGNNLSNYVDLVLCGHTHRRTESNEDGLYFYQFGSYGSYIGDITLTYDTKDKKITNTRCSVINSNTINGYLESIDSNIESIIDEYKSQCELEANEVVVSEVSGYWGKTEQLPNLMAKAIYDTAVTQGYTVDLAYTNESRNYIDRYKENWLYSDIYSAFPFDNTVFIAEVTGEELYQEVYNYNNVYFNPSFNKTIIADQKYTVAIIDYLLYHTNSNRYYDFFSSLNPDTSIKGIITSNYRLLLKEWLNKEGYTSGEKTLLSDDYLTRLDSFNGKSVVLEQEN